MTGSMGEPCSAACVRVLAPAKLNLFLEVLARRADGYHEIETLMVAVSVYDTVEFTARADRALQVECDLGVRRQANAADDTLGQVPSGVDNLAYQAVDRLRRATGVAGGASLRITKRIPAAAGLGGASSDAAAALRAANTGWKLGWSLARLRELAATIGSDVPFFLGGGAAICTGRGEQIQPVGVPANLHFVIVRPPEGLSTAAVYRRCEPAKEIRRAAPLIAQLQEGRTKELARYLFNRLQPAAARLTPWIERLQDEFERLDCVGHQMTGSGTSYFGICRHARHARRVAARLRALSLGDVRVASSVTIAVPESKGASV